MKDALKSLEGQSEWLAVSTKKDNEPAFGELQNAPPSFFARVPTRAIFDALRVPSKKGRAKTLTLGELHVLCGLCSYANNQGFAWPSRDKLARVLGMHGDKVSLALKKCEGLGYVKKISKFRSDPKWTHVYGTVWRVIYDDRLSDDELMDSMIRETPPPIKEKDLPTDTDTDNQDNVEEGGELGDFTSIKQLAFWYTRLVEEQTGQLRLVNPAAIEGAQEALKKHDSQQIKQNAGAIVKECRDRRQPPPQHLGFLAK